MTHPHLVATAAAATAWLLVCQCMAQASPAVVVTSAQQLVAIYNTTSQTFTTTSITLAQDITFDAQTVASLPLGGTTYNNCVPFSGTFEGNNHTISGLTLSSNKLAALFCGLEDATVANLWFDASCSFSGSHAAALAMEVSGAVQLTNLHSAASVSCTSNKCGGLVAYAPSTTTFAMTSCTNTGSVTAHIQSTFALNGLVGGLVGSVTGPNTTVTNCTNSGPVVCTNPGASCSVGGIAGQLSDSTSGKLASMSHCTNWGDVQASASTTVYTGGIAGLGMGVNMISTTNWGSVTTTNGTTSSTGGVCGRLRDTSWLVATANHGNVTSTECTQSSSSGGIVGTTGASQTLHLVGVLNTGNITSTATNTSTTTSAGGLVGGNLEPKAVAAISGGVNKGTVEAGGMACGIGCEVASLAGVVNLGTVVATQTHPTSPTPGTDVFAGQGACSPADACTNIPQVEWNAAEEAFTTVDPPHTLVADVLNNATGSPLWSNSLALVVPSATDQVVVAFGAPAATQVVAVAGVVFDQVVAQAEQQCGLRLANYQLVDNGSWALVDDQQLVWADMVVALCQRVVVFGPGGGAVAGVHFVVHNTSIAANPDLAALVANTSLVVNCTDGSGTQVDCLAPVVAYMYLRATLLPHSSSSSSSTSSSSSSSSTSLASTTSHPDPTHQIVIDLDGPVPGSPDEVKAEVVALGQDVTVTGVEVVVDPSTGLVVQVVVNISATQDQAQALVDNILASSNDQNCAAGVLCRVTDVNLTDLTSTAWTAHLHALLLLLVVLLHPFAPPHNLPATLHSLID